MATRYFIVHGSFCFLGFGVTVFWGTVTEYSIICILQGTIGVMLAGVSVLFFAIFFLLIFNASNSIYALAYLICE